MKAWTSLELVVHANFIGLYCVLYAFIYVYFEKRMVKLIALSRSRRREATDASSLSRYIRHTLLLILFALSSGEVRVFSRASNGHINLVPSMHPRLC